MIFWRLVLIIFTVSYVTILGFTRLCVAMSVVYLPYVFTHPCRYGCIVNNYKKVW